MSLVSSSLEECFFLRHQYETHIIQTASLLPSLPPSLPPSVPPCLLPPPSHPLFPRIQPSMLQPFLEYLREAPRCVPSYTPGFPTRPPSHPPLARARWRTPNAARSSPTPSATAAAVLPPGPPSRAKRGGLRRGLRLPCRALQRCVVGSRLLSSPLVSSRAVSCRAVPCRAMPWNESSPSSNLSGHFDKEICERFDTLRPTLKFWELKS